MQHYIEELKLMNEEQLLDLMIRVAQDIQNTFIESPCSSNRKLYFENWRDINSVLKMRQKIDTMNVGTGIAFQRATS